MLLSPDHLSEGLGRFAPDAFYVEAHSMIFTAMRALHHDDQKVNIVTLGDWVQTAGKLDEIPGGRAYLTSLCEAVFSPSMFSSYAKGVEEKRRQRQLHYLGLRLHHASQNGTDLGELVDDVERTLAAVKIVPAEPEVQRTGDDFAFTWPGEIVITVTMLREAADGVHAEVGVEVASRRVDWGRLNLASRSQRRELAQKLEKVRPGFEWGGALEAVCRTTTVEFRRGDPIVELQPHLPSNDTADHYLVDPILPLNRIAGMYGDGGVGKSTLADALALAVRTGIALPGGLRPTRRGNVLILDYEEEHADHEERLACLAVGFGIAPPDDGILYRNLWRPLVGEVERIRADIRQHHIALVIVDNFASAAGEGPEGADACIPLMNALRSFAVTCWVNNHVTKAGAGQKGGADPYGSVFFKNRCRRVWQIRKAEGAINALVIGLFDYKRNRGPKLPPIGLRFEFDGETGPIRITTTDIADEPDLLAGTSLSYRILQHLRHGAHTTGELAELCEASESEIRARATTLRKQSKVIVVGKRDGQNDWGLPTR